MILRFALLLAYLAFAFAPFAWLARIALAPAGELESAGPLSLAPAAIDLSRLIEVASDPAWRESFLFAAGYVALNVALTLAFALPAAYGFSRRRFWGDRRLLGWLLACRLAPPAVFAAPFVQFAASLELAGSPVAVALAHALFTLPIAIWTLEGAMARIPKEIDEEAHLDGFGFWTFFWGVLIPEMRGGLAAAAAVCALFSWIELVLARALAAPDTPPIGALVIDAARRDPGLAAAGALLSILPSALVIALARRHLARGLSLGRL